MSATVRPLPIEAASQRTENDAVTKKSSKEENPGGFDLLLDLQSGHAQPEKESSGKEEPVKVPQASLDSAPWTVLGYTSSQLFLQTPPESTSLVDSTALSLPVENACDSLGISGLSRSEGLPSEHSQLEKQSLGKEEPARIQPQVPLESTPWTALGYTAGRLLLQTPPEPISSAGSSAVRPPAENSSKSPGISAPAMQEVPAEPVLASLDLLRPMAQPRFSMPDGPEPTVSEPIAPIAEPSVAQGAVGPDLGDSGIQALQLEGLEPLADEPVFLERTVPGPEPLRPGVTREVTRPPSVDGPRTIRAVPEKELPPIVGPEMAEIALPPPEPQQKPHGITAAREVSMVLTTEKSADSSSNEQLSPLLPLEAGAERTRAAEFVRPSLKALEAMRVEFKDGAVAEGTFAFEPRFEISALPEVGHLPEIRTASVIDSIQQHVQIIRSTGQRELEVVIRPDNETELHLHIRNEGGQLFLQARCERGDHRWLESQWSSIQNSLNAQGVRVEPLEAAFRAQHHTSSGSMASDSDARRESPRGPNDFSSEQDLPKTSKTKRTSAGSAIRGRGWQSWA